MTELHIRIFVVYINVVNKNINVKTVVKQL